MKKNLIEKIYGEYVNSDEYNASSYEETKEYKTAQKAFAKDLKTDDILMDATVMAEKYGFIMGFKLAMRLRDECRAEV